MTQKIQFVLNKILRKIKVDDEDFKLMEKSVKEFKENLNKRIKKLKIDADIFVGGSFAKKTLIKKDFYDADIFLRFSKDYIKKDISKLTEKLLKKFGGVSKIHGSRDYFRIKKSNNFFIELIPVIKVKNPEKSENITDLSFSHVKYINKKIGSGKKSQKILDNIKIAKAFCHFANVYGAESYIRGFSGYSLELLIYYYGSFQKFLKEMIKYNGEKIIIDIEKYYRGNEVLFDMNSSKLESPVILVDPTFKQRNALAALSGETFKRFLKISKKFLKNPSIKYFESRKIDLEQIKKRASKKNYGFILLEAKTNKQEGDIAGTKLLKFYNHLNLEIAKFFELKDSGFNYSGKKNAKYFFVVKNKTQIILKGPYMDDQTNLKKFKRNHKNIFYKKNRIYAKEKFKFGIKYFIENWKKNYSKKMRDMDIIKLKTI